MTLLHARQYSSLPLVTCKIIMVNVIPPDHDHDVPVVKPNKHDDAPVVPEPVLEDEDEDLEEYEFEEEEDPQEDEDEIEIDIEEDENEPKLTYPYKEVDPLNPPPPASESEPEDVIEVKNTIESEDEPASVEGNELRETSTGLEFIELMIRGQDTALAVRECTFAGFMKCDPTVFCGVEGAVKLRIWMRKLGVFLRLVNVQKRFNELALMCPRMVEPERVKVDAYIRGLTDNIKGEVTSSKPADLNEAVRMAHKFMEQKS
ncbi:hypothetical protein Tco_1380465 [Tanacetum coccineum]